MSEQKHTPKLEPFGKQVIDGDQRIVAQCKTPELALLLAQAPNILQQRNDLLAVYEETDQLLYQIIKWMGDHGGRGTPLRTRAKQAKKAIGTAIANVEGKSK